MRNKSTSRLLMGLLCLIMSLVMIAPTGGMSVYAADNDQAVTWYDGTYEGTGDGFRGKVTLSVTISDGRISEIGEVSQGETDNYWNQAKELFQTIITRQNTQVDTVSGATASSNGIIAAVNDALAKASIDPDGWYSSGEGTANKPYVIETATQLSAFAKAVDEGESLAGSYVALGADIVLPRDQNWNPIGGEGTTGSAAKFAGVFDGKGHTIDGMTITGDGYTAETNVGLFSSLPATAAVKNLKLTNVNIDVKGSAVMRAGAITGDTQNGSATAGTLIDRCSAEGKVSADSTGQALVYAGGILGRAMSWVKVSNCWTDVDAAAVSRGGSNSAYAGGILGMSGNNTLIVNAASFGYNYGSSPKSTTNGGFAGGLGGMMTSKVWNGYATGDSTNGSGGVKHKWVGALAGQIPKGGMVDSTTYPETGPFRDFCYYPGNAVLTMEKWNSAGTDIVESAVTELRASGLSTSNPYDEAFESKAAAMDRSAMATQDFADTLNSNLKSVRKLLDAYGYGDVEIRNWEVSDGKVLPVGEKWVNTDPSEEIFEGGTGTEEDPFQIKTEEQLRAFAGSLTEGIDCEGYFVKIVDDIDISSAQWMPIGGQDFAFNGTFDGAGHKITGMNAGTSAEPYTMGRDNPYFGFFGVLGKDANIKDVHLEDVEVYAYSPQYVFVGGIAATNDAAAESYKAMVIDGCSVTGKMVVSADKSNAFLGGIEAQQYRGAMINCWTDLDLSCTVKTGNAIAEVGGLVGLNNRGLVANSYTLGDVYGSASRNNGDEGMASTGNLVGVQAGSLTGCYSKGNNTTGEYSVYAGEITGWITGIGKAYSCWYNNEAAMNIGGRAVVPPADYGTKVAPGVNDEGDAYVGGIVDDLNGYTGQTYKDVAEKLNAVYDKYPTDISIYGLTGEVLNKWKYDAQKGIVTFDSEKTGIRYVQPEAEIVPPDVEEMRDGTWFGRDRNTDTVVSVKVEGGKVVGEPEVISGNKDDSAAVESAAAIAREKSIYGDTSGYGRAKAELFDGGTGTEADPYQIRTEEQLRAIAEALNEDERFENVWFKQTANIQLSDKNWLPIGYGIMAKINSQWKQYATYPFMGNYDGDGYKVTGLTIGKEDEPCDDPRMIYTAGMFGFISGGHATNDMFKEGERISDIRNVSLRDENIYVSSIHTNYVGGLAGIAQNGFTIDNCSVTGSVSSFSRDALARAGGLMGSAVRGVTTNSWADAAVTCKTADGNSYAGGLLAQDNRACEINCYALGDVVADAGANNKVHAGGLTGMIGGAHYNCYTSGNVTALKTTSDVGLVNGRASGISVMDKVYYNSDAKLTVAGRQIDPVANGVVVDQIDPEDIGVTARSAQDIKSIDFADEMNLNREQAETNIEKMRGIIKKQTDLVHNILFTGTGNDLLSWEADEVVTLTDSGEGISIIREKENALAEMKEAYDAYEVDPDVQKLCNDAYLEAVEAIGKATDRTGIREALETAKEAFAEVKRQSDKLKLVKEMARNEIVTHRISDYSGENLDQLLDIMLDAQKKIDSAKTTAEVESILKDAKAKAGEIKTDAQIEAEWKAAHNIAKATITVASQVYSGTPKRPAPKVILNGETLRSGTDYTATYRNNINAGTATVTVSGLGDYNGSASKSFTIGKAENRLLVAGRTVKISYAALKKANQYVTVRNAVGITRAGQGSLKYIKVAGSSSKITVNQAGKVTVGKGLPKGTYRLTVRVIASGNANYRILAKNAVVTINVR